MVGDPIGVQVEREGPQPPLGDRGRILGAQDPSGGAQGRELRPGDVRGDSERPPESSVDRHAEARPSLALPAGALMLGASARAESQVAGSRTDERGPGLMGVFAPWVVRASDPLARKHFRVPAMPTSL